MIAHTPVIGTMKEYTKYFRYSLYRVSKDRSEDKKVAHYLKEP
jgi:hypothetical protein